MTRPWLDSYDGTRVETLPQANIFSKHPNVVLDKWVTTRNPPEPVHKPIDFLAVTVDSDRFGFLSIRHPTF